MPSLPVEPTPINRAKKHPYRGKPFTRATRRTSQVAEYPTRRSGFTPEIQLSHSSGKFQEPREKVIYDLLTDNALDPMIEPYALKILRNGTKNGTEGWFVPDFFVPLGDEEELVNLGRGGVYIEVSMGEDLTNKKHKIRFVAEKYGILVLHVTRDNINGFLKDPDSLIQRIFTAWSEQRRIEEADEAQAEGLTDVPVVDIIASHAMLGTTLEPRLKLERARKPKKGRQPQPRKMAKVSTKPSRDPERRSERRALRKQARELCTSVPQIKRERSFKIITVTGSIPARVYSSAPKRTKTTAGPKPPRTARVNHGPLKSPQRRLSAAA